ncbi:hypothetical protein ACQ86G_15800 [Roseateles chitinivorans]|uniref:hypothetical protein n=1 Tax=Roseateles chitinivorans TaxID=2917965 RepID=UPI003D67330D
MIGALIDIMNRHGIFGWGEILFSLHEPDCQSDWIGRAAVIEYSDAFMIGLGSGAPEFMDVVKISLNCPESRREISEIVSRISW